MIAEAQETALVRIETISPAQLFVPEVIDPILDAIRAEVRKQAAELDIATPDSRKAIASLAFKVAKSKTFIDGQRKSLVEDEKKRLKAIDREGARIWDELEALQAEVRKPLTDWENRDKERIAKHEAGLKLMQTDAVLDRAATTEDIRRAIACVESFESNLFEEFSGRALAIQATTLSSLNRELKLSIQADEDRAEMDRLRAENAERAQRERDEAIAKAAREKAEAEAHAREQAALAAAERERQRIENEKFEAEAKAKQAEAARVAAEEKAARDAEAAEQARLDAIAWEETYRKKVAADHAAELERIEQKRVADEQAALEASRQAVLKAKADQDAAVESERQRAAAEQRRVAAEAEARAKDKAHKATINREILAAILGDANLSLSESQAKILIADIANGKIPHVSINY